MRGKMGLFDAIIVPAAVLSLVSGLLASGFAAAGQIERPPLSIIYTDIGQTQAEAFAAEAEKSYRAVTSYLGRGSGQTIKVEIGNAIRIPDADIQTRTVSFPANRIRGDAGGPPPYRGRGPAIAHALTMIIAPSGNPNWKDFLESGFGSFVQEKFGGPNDRSYPNMGRDLHQATADMIARYGRFIPLDEAAAARTGGRPFSRTVVLAFLEEGSFVRWLVENYGLERYLAVHDGQRDFGEAFGKPFCKLEIDWARQLGARNDALGAKAEKWAGCACMTPGQPRNDCHFR